MRRVGLINYLQGMGHGAAEHTWESMSGLFQLEANARSIRLSLRQSSLAGDTLGGTRAAIDDVEVLVFEALDWAEYYRDLYLQSHPTTNEGPWRPDRFSHLLSPYIPACIRHTLVPRCWAPISNLLISPG